MNKDIEKVLVTKEQLQTRIKEVADEISRDYAGKVPLLVGILKGSIMFYADLTRQLSIPCEMDFMCISSYGSGTESTGKVNIRKDCDKSIEGRDVIIVEDIVDTGNTLDCLKKMLYPRNPASIKICTLLDKPSRRTVDLVPEYKCFEIPNEFVIGYGLDYDERYRELDEVCVLSPSVYAK